jgi:hypothetical protein
VTSDQGGKHKPDFAWLVNDLVQRVHGVTHALILSVDGLRLTASDTMSEDDGDHLAAIASGVLGLARSGGGLFEMGTCEQIIHRHSDGYFLFMHMGTGGGLVVLTGPKCDMQVVAYEMTQFVTNVGDRLTPEVRARLRPVATAARHALD